MDSNRTLAVQALRAGCLAALALVAALAACDEETTVEPPPPPTQIGTVRAYTKSATGLPNGDVYAFLTLTNGEFWIGTEQGIARYASVNADQRIAGPDGIINELNGLPNPKVRDIVLLNGKVYVATWGGGFAIYDVGANTWTSRTPADDTADDVFGQAMFLGRTFSNRGSAVIVQPGPNGVLETVPGGDDRVVGQTIVDGPAVCLNPPEPTCQANGIAETTPHQGLDGSIADLEPSTTDGKLYIATNHAISIYDPVLDRFSSFLTLTREVVSTVVVRDTPAGLERWYGPRVETVEEGTPPPAGITVWRGTSLVYSYTMVNSGLAEPNVTSIFYDPVGGNDNVWVATANSGVSLVNVDESTWTTYTALQGLPSNTVYSVTRANNTIWVATQNGIAYLRGDGTWQGYNTSGGLAADRVRKIYSDNGTNLWIGYIGEGAALLDTP